MKDTILDKDTIAVTIGDDHAFNCTAVTIGRTGEHSVSQLEITIPDELCSFWAFLDFKKPRGELVKTEQLTIVNNKIEYDIPNGLLDENGNLEVQLVLQAENGEVWKSAVKKFVVLKSIDATEDIPEKEDFITEAQRILNETEETLEMVLDVREGDAPAIREQVNGNPVRIDDISPLDHTLKVEARCKNLIPRPYQHLSSTTNGITFAANEDGSVRVSGTATANAMLYLYTDKNNLPSGVQAGLTYTPSIKGATNNNVILMCNIYDAAGVGASWTTTAMGTKVFPSTAVGMNIYLLVVPGTTVDTTVYPQLELGSVATAYAPYRESVTVWRGGKNVIQYPYFRENGYTFAGITWTVNGDGSVIANGTATAHSIFLCRRHDFTLPPGTYTISGAPGGSQTSYNMQLQYTNAETGVIVTTLNVNEPQTFTLDVECTVLLQCVIYNGYTAQNTSFKPQLEIGATATEFEPYRGETYTADGAGDVDGITSIYPTTTLIADDGVIITAEYNADTKKYIDRKFAELATLIANE